MNLPAFDRHARVNWQRRAARRAGLTRHEAMVDVGRHDAPWRSRQANSLICARVRRMSWTFHAAIQRAGLRRLYFLAMSRDLRNFNHWAWRTC